MSMISIGAKTGFAEGFSMDVKEITSDVWCWREYLLFSRTRLDKELNRWKKLLKFGGDPMTMEGHLKSYQETASRMRGMGWALYMLDQFSCLLEGKEINHDIKAVELINVFNYVMTTYSNQVDEEGDSIEAIHCEDNTSGEDMDFSMKDMLIKPSILIGALKRFEEGEVVHCKVWDDEPTEVL